MNFRRIFLVKCLLLWFPNVKGADTRRIYVAVDGSAFLSIMTTGTVHEATWSRNDQRLLQIKNKKIKYYTDRKGCRCNVLFNGTLQIQPVKKEDSGTYTVLVYHEDGKLKAEEKTALIVQEPVPQPIIYAECINKTTTVKCEVKQTTNNQTFMIEVAHDKIRRSNLTKVEFTTTFSGRFRCTVKNEVSEKTTEKQVKCSGQLDFYLIISIAGGAVLLVAFVILLIFCIRKKKTQRLEDDDEERMMQARKVETEMAVRELPRPPANPTPRQVRLQQRPLPQPQGQQQAMPPWPRPRTQPRTPTQPRERP
ncbi:T-cell surface antigen CD2 [Oxyura jamaicensis]|uniref:T-cell surface antigen CD2 n=1 Tax=Oxyura jamaicensis TaxID=8884 RepID=UPI0015A6C46C|nr:T-cell surface antigen CD2 [Oxyura jamaicensis]